MLVIGVTGGLGTGKSTVTRMLKQLGARTLDADALAHQAIARGTSGWRAVRRTFGPRVMTLSGEIDRRALAQIVFNDRRQLQRLCRIIHPIVIRQMARAIRALRARRSTGVVVVDVPLLIEARLTRTVDCVVVVTARRAQQIQRVQRATGWPRADILRRIQAQLPLAVKVKAADVVISNSGTTIMTRRHVRALWKKLKAQPK